MQHPHKGTLLRIFTGECDRGDGKPLLEDIVLKAREAHLAGATVLRGPLGFGRSGHLHTAKILRLSDDLPVVIEIIDTDEKIQAFLPQLAPFAEACLITLANVLAIRVDNSDAPVTAQTKTPD